MIAGGLVPVEVVFAVPERFGVDFAVEDEGGLDGGDEGGGGEDGVRAGDGDVEREDVGVCFGEVGGEGGGEEFGGRGELGVEFEANG